MFDLCIGDRLFALFVDIPDNVSPFARNTAERPRVPLLARLLFTSASVSPSTLCLDKNVSYQPLLSGPLLHPFSEASLPDAERNLILHFQTKTRKVTNEHAISRFMIKYHIPKTLGLLPRRSLCRFNKTVSWHCSLSGLELVYRRRVSSPPRSITLLSPTCLQSKALGGAEPLTASSCSYISNWLFPSGIHGMPVFWPVSKTHSMQLPSFHLLPMQRSLPRVSPGSYSGLTIQKPGKETVFQGR